MRIKDYAGAIECLQKAIGYSPAVAGPEAHDYLGHIFLETGQLGLARQNFQECLRVNNLFWDALLGLALLSFQELDIPNARAYLARSSEIEPRIKEGMDGIKKLEAEGWSFSDKRKESLRLLFEAAQ